MQVFTQHLCVRNSKSDLMFLQSLTANLPAFLQEVSLSRGPERWRSRCGRSGDEDGFSKTSRRLSRTEPGTRDDPERELKIQYFGVRMPGQNSALIHETLEFVY